MTTTSTHMPVSYNTQPALPPNRPPSRRVFPGAAGGSYYPLLKEGISRKPPPRTPERSSPVDGEGGAGVGERADGKPEQRHEKGPRRPDWSEDDHG
jgi:hypothetical protein